MSIYKTEVRTTRIDGESIKSFRSRFAIELRDAITAHGGITVPEGGDFAAEFATENSGAHWGSVWYQKSGSVNFVLWQDCNYFLIRTGTSVIGVFGYGVGGWYNGDLYTCCWNESSKSPSPDLSVLNKMTMFRTNIVHYTSDNGNVLLHIQDFDKKNHGFNVAFLDIVDKDGNELYECLYFMGSLFYKQDEAIKSMTYNVWKPNATVNLGDKLRLCKAELLDANGKLTNTYIKDCYAVIGDGNLINNTVYTINNKQYLYVDGLLFQC